MRANLFIFVLTAVVGVVAAGGVAWADGECPANLNELPKSVGVFVCHCPPGVAEGPVWGSGIYTTDSNVCRAAVHAGVIGARGGSINLRRADGCSAYEGTARHGVKSQPWGSYKHSFYFPQAGDGKCTLKILTTGDPDPAGAAQYRPQDRVMCRWKNGSTEYRGTVMQIEGGRLIVHYDDNDKEAIAPSLCRKATGKDLRPKAAGKRPVTGPSDPTRARFFATGNRVRCRWRDGKKEYPGKVVGIRAGRLKIDYDDGGKELISPSLCRRGQ